jgi:hypothetical protein
MQKANLNRLLASLKEMEELLQFPTVHGHIEKADKLALLIRSKRAERRHRQSRNAINQRGTRLAQQRPSAQSRQDEAKRPPDAM